MDGDGQEIRVYSDGSLTGRRTSRCCMMPCKWAVPAQLAQHHIEDRSEELSSARNAQALPAAIAPAVISKTAMRRPGGNAIQASMISHRFE